MKKNPKFSFAITSFAGSSVANFRKVSKGKSVDPPYRSRFFLSLLVSVILEPFRWWERMRWNRHIRAFKMQEDPVFIIGHWRSGTTLLHNVMSQDSNFGFCNTFQSVFPHLVLSHQRWLEPILRPFLPKTRPSDNVAFNFRDPQEEEIGLGNVQTYSFYHAWYFPREFGKLFRKHILLEGVSPEELSKWKESYLWFIRKAMIRTGGSRFLSKNPTHTARIPLLLEIFPNAKFIFLYRNPYTVFESSRRFVQSTLPALQYQDIDESVLDKTLIKLYTSLIEKYEKDKGLIPEGNLVEVCFEDFEKDKIGGLAHIYEALQLPGFDIAKPSFNQFLGPQKSYQKNQYSYNPNTLSLVNANLGHLVKQWGYEEKEFA